MSFTPHTDSDIQSMLNEINVENIQALFAEVPEDLLVKKKLDLPEPINELEATQLFQARAEQDAGYACYLGAGAYEHYIPAAVWEIAGRGEFLTSYTPYQAEASQGNLQLIYEYQTMMANLMAMEVSNASLYDGATALAEAILMAMRQQEKKKAKKVLLLGTLNPLYQKTVASIIKLQNITLDVIPFSKETGTVSMDVLNTIDCHDAAALVIQQPNFFGQLEAVDALTDWAHKNHLLTIGVVNPVAMALLKPPGQWGKSGTDIACGEGQPLGIPLASGGPYFGFLTCKKVYIRQMPGRIVGRTTDEDGQEGFVLTLQAREQHIRRAKAKSNICTNQGLMVTAATIHMSLMGASGLRRVALNCHEKAMQLKIALEKIPGLTVLFKGPCFHEFIVQVEKTTAKEMLDKLITKKILAGVDLSFYFPELGQVFSVCVTETKTNAMLKAYVAAVKEVVVC